jgi:Tol biopolymer transport system component
MSMPDLNERLRTVDRVPVPDLWERARGSAASEPTDRAREPRVQRFVVVVVALVIAGSAFGALVFPFHGGRGAAYSPGPHPDGAIVTVERGATGELGVENLDLVAIDPETGRTVDLTPGPAAESDPVWSPDGTRVAFLRATSSGRAHVTISKGLFVMNADGSGVHKVYACASADQCEMREFAWSPDDRYLAWTLERARQEGGAVLEILDLTTGRIADACANDSCGQSLVQLAWAPDASRLAFTDAAVLPGAGGPPASSIWLVKPDGSDLKRLTEGSRCYAQKGPVNSCFADTLPAWSPDGRTLAFLHQATGASGAGGTTSLTLMSLEGNSIRREIAPCPDGSSCQPSAPEWSPDGTSILFDNGYGETARILLLDPVSGQVREVAATGTPGCVGPVGPFWSPDGKQIAFIGGPGRAANLCVVPQVGGVPQILIPHLAGYWLSSGTGFTWLPAGAIDLSSATPFGSTTGTPKGGGPPEGTIFFTSSNGSNQEEDGVEIWSMAADGSRARPLTSDQVAEASPSISPAGSQIVFVRSGQIWAIGVDGSDAHALTNLTGNVGSPAWSPDGRQIAFSLSSGNAQRPDGLYVMGADGSDPHLIAPGSVFSLAWRPGASEITFTLATSDGGLHLRNVDLTTGTVKPFLDLPGDQEAPAWSPDGSTLAFAWSSIAGGTGMYLADADGSNLRRVVGAPFNAGDSGLGIAWSPDGTWLSFEGIDARFGPQIYAIRSDGTDLQRLTDQPGFITGTSIYAMTGNPSWGP